MLTKNFKNDLWLEFYGPKSFLNILKKKKFHDFWHQKFLKFAILEPQKFSFISTFDWLEKKFGMLDTNSIFFPYVGNIDLSNAPTFISVVLRHTPSNWHFSCLGGGPQTPFAPPTPSRGMFRLSDDNSDKWNPPYFWVADTSGLSDFEFWPLFVT